MVNFKHVTLSAYLEQMSSREPVPGGGSAAALTAALGAGLISMVTRFSIGRKANTQAVEKRLANILRTSEAMRKRLLVLTTLDSQAYLKIVAARNLDARARKKAARGAAAVGKEVCRLCYKAVDLTSFLAAKGNPHLMSDIEVALELLKAAFNASMVMVQVNRENSSRLASG